MNTVGIRLKILLAFVLTLAFIGALIASDVALQWSTVEQAAELEATNLARSVAYGAMKGPGSFQSYAEGLDELYKRRIVFVDTRQIGLADAHETTIGREYLADANDEVGATIRDGQPRAFIDNSAAYAAGGLREVTVPLYANGRPGSAITGAVVLDYTDISAQLHRRVLRSLYLVGAGGLACLTLVGLVGWKLARSVTRRLATLQHGVERVAAGHYDERLPVSTNDELGKVKIAFNGMTAALETARAEAQAMLQKQTASAQEIERLAFFDKLTGLPNRAHLSRAFDAHLAPGASDGKGFALLFIDLDRFKDINNALGHLAGDQLLRVLSRRMVEVLGPAALCARLGGDEFVVLAEELPGAGLTRLIERLMRAISLPMDVNGNAFGMTASIGVGLYPADGRSEHALLKHAEIAMYKSKEEGRNCCSYYSDALDDHSIERLAFESSLRTALELGQFTVFYQAKIDSKTLLTSGFEALIRWKHPKLGMVSPVKFIPVAEETGLIVDIGKWVLRQACIRQVAWRQLVDRPLHMAVNLSVRQFADEHLLSDVAQILAETGMNPCELELEITESLLMHDVDKGIRVLMQLRDMGIKLSIDDFGTGYSSLSNLRRFPVDTLKIDRSFIRDLPAKESDRTIALAIIRMAKSLGLGVVAEGVETSAQCSFLFENGCDQLQGYYFGKPAPSADAEDGLRNERLAGFRAHVPFEPSMV